MDNTFISRLRTELQEIDEAGLYKRERIITSPQGAEITVSAGARVLNIWDFPLIPR